MSAEFEPKYEKGQELSPDSKSMEKLSERNLERMEKAAAEAEAKRDSIEAIQERIEKAAQSLEKLKAEKAEIAGSETIPRANTKLKSHAYEQTLRRTQKKLPRRDRAFSKVIHQPAVEAISEAAGATVARPSGLLMGGIFSVISSLGVLYICRHYGYEYNFTIGLASFAGGFALGIILEGILKLFKR